MTIVNDSAADQSRQQLVDALERVSIGDQTALRDVYERTSAKLFGICLRICRDQSAAEDILQEVYVSIWRRAHQFDATRASPITWLSTIARNRAIDWFRAKHPAGLVTLHEADNVADPQPLADSVLEMVGDSARLGQCLQQLDARDHVLITTAFFEGTTYAALSTRVAQPLSTIKSRIRRALLSLRECLADD